MLRPHSAFPPYRGPGCVYEHDGRVVSRTTSTDPSERRVAERELHAWAMRERAGGPISIGVNCGHGWSRWRDYPPAGASTGARERRRERELEGMRKTLEGAGWRCTRE